MPFFLPPFPSGVPARARSGDGHRSSHTLPGETRVGLHLALKDISGCRACPEDVSTWRKWKRDPVLAVPLSLPTRCVLLGAIPFSRRPRATVPASVLGLDRKSTRLNSSHGYISYAVFCLKKKKNHIQACFCEVLLDTC